MRGPGRANTCLTFLTLTPPLHVILGLDPRIQVKNYPNILPPKYLGLEAENISGGDIFNDRREFVSS